MIKDSSVNVSRMPLPHVLEELDDAGIKLALFEEPEIVEVLGAFRYQVQGHWRVRVGSNRTMNRVEECDRHVVVNAPMFKDGGC